MTTATTKIKKFQSFSDPAHGWGKVSRKDLVNLGIADKISSCSYQFKSFVYLEEDCDLSIFVNAMKERNITVNFKTSWTNKRSKIRNYDCYKMQA